MTPPPAAQLVHATAGRLRVRVPSMRGDAMFFSHLVESMEKNAALGNVHANEATGSILLEGCALSADQFRALARKRNWLDVQRVDSVDSGANAGRSTGGLMQDSLGVISLVLTVLATVQAREGRFLPSVVTLLKYAFEFARMRRGDPMS